jgi:hypothetical protein
MGLQGWPHRTGLDDPARGVNVITPVVERRRPRRAQRQERHKDVLAKLGIEPNGSSTPLARPLTCEPR